MRLQHQDLTFNTNRKEQQGAFSIKATGKAFRVLIDGLYSDKVQSIVRELASNAFDSHRVVKNKAPFFVHCPTTLRPEFYVRDFGIGMTHDKVMNLYSTLFESDKDDTDDLVGMLGLGSKSPFAYSDQFYLSCFDGSTVRHYAAAIGSDGVPQIVLMQTDNSDEEQGIRVGFAVKNEDFDIFKKATQRVGLGFDPAFETNVTLLTQGQIFLQGSDWKCFEAGNLTSQWNVRQGCVIYPLETQKGVNLPSDFSGRKWLLDCPIGTIEVTTSRESVAYTDRVVAYLNERIDTIKVEVPDMLKGDLEKIENVLEYFTSARQKIPNFCQVSLVHPFTGLKEAKVSLPTPACAMSVSCDANSGRWEYTPSTYLTCTLKEAVRRPAFWIKDISRLLDKGREKETPFKTREHRRVARAIRAWMTMNKHKRAEFWLGFDFDSEFLNRTVPNIDLTVITIDDLFGAIPKVPVEERKPAIRGVNLASLTKDNSVSVQTKTLEKKASRVWVEADSYRVSSTYLRSLAKKFKFDEAYVTTTNSEERVKEAGIPKLDEAIDASLQKKGLRWDEFCYLAEVTNSITNLDDLLKFATVLHKHNNADYLRLKRSKNLYGAILTCLDSYIVEGHLPFDYDTIKGIHACMGKNTNRYTVAKPLKTPERLKKFALLTAKWKRISTFHPVICSLDLLDRYGKPFKEGNSELTSMLISIAKSCPVSTVFKE